MKSLQFWKSKIFWLIVATVFISSVFGFGAGLISGTYFYLEIKDYISNFPGVERIIEKPIDSARETVEEYAPQTSQEEKIINVVKEVSPAVVSIVITKDLPIFEQYYYNPFGDNPFFDIQIPGQRQIGTEKKEIGGGTGFIVSEDGLVLTNKHVVLDEEADFTVFTNDGRKFPAKVLAKDPFQDLAILKIEKEKVIDGEGDLLSKTFPTVKLGNSDQLQIGQTVVAIGNVLGEFRNSVSVGVVAGLGRTITASGGSFVETIEDVIQTDAAINKGNSGGPLLNLKGEVMGVNTATVMGAQNIGFAIPINKAKKDIEQVKTLGKIVYPFLGVRYVMVTEEVQKENDLSVDYGAWIVASQGEPAIVPGSAAEEAGLKENDIILEFNNEKVTADNSLAKIIMKHNPGDQAVLLIQRGGKQETITVTLGERSE